MNQLHKSCLYVVPTPVGNLGDITFRAVEILKQVDFVLAEDTRKTSVLFHHFDIKTKLVSHHKFNEHRTAAHILQKILSGSTIALVSDAGTPGISDPGYLIVKTCIDGGCRVETLPGATAFVPALVNSGLPCDRFTFEGFLPAKKGRQKRLAALANETRTMVFYESPHRIDKTLKEFAGYFGNDRKACISREISKIYEENIRGTISELIQLSETKDIKGEIVIVVEGKEKQKSKENDTD